MRHHQILDNLPQASLTKTYGSVYSFVTITFGTKSCTIQLSLKVYCGLKVTLVKKLLGLCGGEVFTIHSQSIK